jgi:transposase
MSSLLSIGFVGLDCTPAVLFAYSPDRKSQDPENCLAMFRGILQAIALRGFNRRYEESGILEAACWAHVRRKFYDLFEAHASPIAKGALDRIAALYVRNGLVHG